MFDPGIQRGDDRIEWIFAHAFNRCGQLEQSSERNICRIGIERPAANPQHPAVKAALARLPSEPGRQMQRFPGDRRVVVPPIIRAPAHQGKFGKRRRKQVAADAGQSSAIPEDEEMIDQRPMAVDRLQLGIDCQIGLTGLAAAIPHLTRLALAGAIVVDWARLVELPAHRLRGYGWREPRAFGNRVAGFGSGCAMMVDNKLVDGNELEPVLENLLTPPNVDYLYVHFAAGCYAAKVERA
jgi:hypothetical protein